MEKVKYQNKRFGVYKKNTLIYQHNKLKYCTSFIYKHYYNLFNKRKEVIIIIDKETGLELKY